MIKIYKELNVHDFRNEFEGLDNTAWGDEWQALGVLFDWLESIGDGSHDETNIKDWLKFQVMEMTADEIEESYSVDFERFPEIEDFLNYYSMLYGMYELDGETYYLFSEF